MFVPAGWRCVVRRRRNGSCRDEDFGQPQSDRTWTQVVAGESDAALGRGIIRARRVEENGGAQSGLNGSSFQPRTPMMS